jgi:hypothetical protein
MHYYMKRQKKIAARCDDVSKKEEAVSQNKS